MAAVRFYDRTKGTYEVLPAASLKQARLLFKYAVSCATANMRIELMSGGKIIRTHWVDYVENIPSVADMPTY